MYGIDLPTPLNVALPQYQTEQSFAGCVSAAEALRFAALSMKQ
jgi:hypothetical protein